MAWQLSRKDNLYNVLVTEKIKDLDLNDIKHLWLVKPVASSRGRGIRLLTEVEENELKSEISKNNKSKYKITNLPRQEIEKQLKKYNIVFYPLASYFVVFLFLLFHSIVFTSDFTSAFSGSAFFVSSCFIAFFIDVIN